MPWLMKAEPDSRIVKGKDVKFSVDDFEEMGESPWDGVRNHEAKKIMKEKMKLGDRVLFYHSNCKVPGVFALAEVAKEGYPDYTAFDTSHPYYDPKSSKDSPTWYMVNVRFVSRLKHPVTLAWVKKLAGLNKPPEGVAYIGAEGLKAIKEMPLVNRGRLSVQPVSEEAYDAIVAMGEKGGMDELPPPKKSRAKESKEEAEDEDVPPPKKSKAGAKVKREQEDELSEEESKPQKAPRNGQIEDTQRKPKKAKTDDVEHKPKEVKKEPEPAPAGTRRSARLRK